MQAREKDGADRPGFGRSVPYDFPYAVMQVLYVSSMQWPSAVRLMRGI